MDTVQAVQTENNPEVKRVVKGRIPPREIAVFCSQASMLLKAGIPLHEGLENMTEEYTATGGSLLKGIAAKVEETGSLYEAVEDAGVFPSYMVQMIRIGETVGKLEDVLESLSAYYNREGRIREAVRSAVLYPVILIFLMAAVIGVLVAVVLPVFSEVLEGLGSDVTGSDAGFMDSGIFIGKITLIAMGAILVLLIAVLAVSITAGGRAKLMQMSGNLPFLRKLYSKMSSSRFALVISMMLTSGFDLNETLEMSGKVVSDGAVKVKIDQCREKVNSGKSFSESLLEIGLFSGLYARMIQTGERTGRLDEVMDKLAAQYSDEADESISTLIALIEPTLVVILSVIIGSILLSIMLPLIQVMSQIG